MTRLGRVHGRTEDEVPSHTLEKLQADRDHRRRCRRRRLVHHRAPAAEVAYA